MIDVVWSGQEIAGEDFKRMAAAAERIASRKRKARRKADRGS